MAVFYFHGGKIDTKISSDTCTVEIAEAGLKHVRNERGARLAHVWIELEQHTPLGTYRLSLERFRCTLDVVGKSGGLRHR